MSSVYTSSNAKGAGLCVHSHDAVAAQLSHPLMNVAIGYVYGATL